MKSFTEFLQEAAKKAPVMNATKYVKQEPGNTLWDKAISFWDDDMWVTVVKRIDYMGEVKGKEIFIVGSNDTAYYKQNDTLYLNQQGRNIGDVTVVDAGFKITNIPAQYKNTKSATIYTLK